MALRERITVAIDFVTDGATRGLGNIKSAVKDADGAVGKFKAGSQAAFAGFGQYAAQGALAAGTALVAFGTQAVGAFQETALGAGKLRDSLGLTAEEASRLQEVGDDLGISQETLESTIGRMNRTAELSPGKFDEIGAAISRNKDGTINVNETFLNTVDALNKIPDASRRAARAQEIFGRSWQDISELVGLGADGVREAMASVESAKVIDDEEIAKARRFRDTMDRLKGIYEDWALTVGELLVPALTEVGDSIAAIKSATDKLPDLPGWMKDALSWAGPIAQARRLAQGYEWLGKQIGLVDDETATTTATLDTAASSTFAWSERTDYLAKSLEDNVAESLRLVAERTQRIEDVSRDLQRQWDTMMGTLTNEESYLSIQDGFAKVRDAAVESWDAAAAGAEDADQKARDHRQSLIDLQQEVIDYGQEILQLPPERLTTVLALIDQGSLEEAEAILAILTRNRTMSISIETKGGMGYIDFDGKKASGGPVRPGGTYLVGEEGPEILQMGNQSGNVIPNDRIGWGGGGNTFVFQSLVSPSEAQLQEFQRWIERVERRKRGGL